MHKFHCDEQKCVSCGQCARDCLLSLLSMESGHPVMTVPEKCIGCLHCFAICPTGAIRLDDYRPEEAPGPRPLPSLEQARAFAFQRRSIRRFKRENCDPVLIRGIMEDAFSAPSGVNQRLLLASAIIDGEVMDSFRRLLYAGIKKIAASPDSPLTRLIHILGEDKDEETWIKEDKVLRGAPHFVACSHSRRAITGEPDCFIYLSLFEELAVAAGIGTVWCGYLTHCLKAMPALREFAGVTPDYQIGYSMLFGAPDVKYARGVRRRPAKIFIASKP